MLHLATRKPLGRRRLIMLWLSWQGVEFHTFPAGKTSPTAIPGSARMATPQLLWTPSAVRSTKWGWQKPRRGSEKNDSSSSNIDKSNSSEKTYKLQTLSAWPLLHPHGHDRVVPGAFDDGVQSQSREADTVSIRRSFSSCSFTTFPTLSIHPRVKTARGLISVQGTRQDYDRLSISVVNVQFHVKPSPWWTEIPKPCHIKPNFTKFGWHKVHLAALVDMLIVYVKWMIWRWISLVRPGDTMEVRTARGDTRGCVKEKDKHGSFVVFP